MKEVALTDYDPETERQVQLQVMHLLHTQVASMNLDNFVVRAKRRSVEKFAKKEAWETLSEKDRQELAHEIASLPTQMERESEEAKRFDLLILNLQLALFGKEPAYERLRDQVVKIAGLLEEKHTIPMVGKQMTYIQDVQTEVWWEDVTVPMLEVIRRRLRDLVQFIEKKERKPIYTNFEDVMGDESNIELSEFVGQDTFERFRDKARAFLRKHIDADRSRIDMGRRYQNATDRHSLSKMSIWIQDKLRNTRCQSCRDCLLDATCPHRLANGLRPNNLNWREMVAQIDNSSCLAGGDNRIAQNRNAEWCLKRIPIDKLFSPLLAVQVCTEDEDGFLSFRVPCYFCAQH